ncbi:PREDICTED: ras-related protein Rab-40C-like, partial [Rhagoletis zephyria]|uniref:ras-related protein Rab-40C-like n=1 Tax=Rhagoletis zephyria TaxID=28612 RepID=UPI0008119A82
MAQINHSDRLRRFFEQFDGALQELSNLENGSEYVNNIEPQPTSPHFQYPSEEPSYDNVFKFLLVGDSDVGKDELLQTLEPSYDNVFKFLLVGDSDVGKDELLQTLEAAPGDSESTQYRSLDVDYKSTSILLNGKSVKLRIWDTSGQGRFSTVFKTYSRGAHGIILVYDITSKWSFESIDHWRSEIDEHAPGVPKILIGNRVHLAFRRQVDKKHADAYAKKHRMDLFEVSALCDHNLQESLKDLSRQVLIRNGMYDIELPVPTLQDLCYRRIVQNVNAYEINNLPIPPVLKSYLRSFSSTLESNQSFEKQ